MDIRPIKTEDDLTWALAEVEPYFLNEPEPGTAEAIRFDILVGLIQGYEAQHWAIDVPAPKQLAAEHRRLRFRALSKKIARSRTIGRNAKAGRFITFGRTRNVRLNRVG
jgi:antitoxin component HigA of HigAB toxin-antitoxin module